MATGLSVSVWVLLYAQLKAILNVDHGGGYDLSGDNQVRYGRSETLGIEAATMGLLIDDVDLQIGIGPLTSVWTNRAIFHIQGWAPVTAISSYDPDLPVRRKVAASLLANKVIGAIQADHAVDGGSNSLFRLCSAVPSFQDLRFPGGGVQHGQDYGRFSVDVYLEYRKGGHGVGGGI